MNIFSVFNKHTDLIKIQLGDQSLFIGKDMSWCFDQEGYYEKNVIKQLNEVLLQLQDVVFYDIGGNYGYFMVTCAKRVNQFYSFEPVPETYNILKKNKKYNKLSNVSIFNIGLFDKRCQMQINRYSSCGNDSLFQRTLPPGHSLKHTGLTTVQLHKLDDFIEKNNLLPPTIIKIDVEGAELNVLKGARKNLELHQPVLFIEYAESTSNDAGYKKEDILNFLRPLHYQFLGIPDEEGNSDLIKEDNFMHATFSNIIAIPQNKIHIVK